MNIAWSITGTDPTTIKAISRKRGVKKSANIITDPVHPGSALF